MKSKRRSSHHGPYSQSRSFIHHCDRHQTSPRQLHPMRKRMIAYVRLLDVEPDENACTIGSPASLQIYAGSHTRADFRLHWASGRRAKNLIGLLRAASPAFRSVVNYWGATNAVLKLDHDPAGLSAPLLIALFRLSLTEAQIQKTQPCVRLVRAATRRC
jgi:hypothetical protein